MMDNSKKITLYILGTIIFALTTFSLAYFTPKVINRGIFSSSGKADHTMIENLVTVTRQADNINLSNTYPMSEEASKKNVEPYYFRIANNSDTTSVDYQIVLEVKSTSTIDDSLISTSLQVNLENNKVNSSSAGYDRAYKIYEGSLVARESETFDLRVWINENGTQENVLNKTWQAKIVVKSTPTIKSSKLRVISGDISTPGSEVKIGSEHFNILANSDGKLIMLAKYGLLLGKKITWDWTDEMTPDGYQYKEEENISSSEFNFGRQDKKVLGFNRYLENGKIDTGMIRDYYGFVNFSDAEHVVNQGTCNDASGVEQPCYSRYEGSLVQEHVNSYVSMLSNETGLKLKGDIPSKEDFISLGCTTDSCNENLSWLYNKSYYLKDTYDNKTVTQMLYFGRFSKTIYSAGQAIFPVIILDLEDLKLD